MYAIIFPGRLLPVENIPVEKTSLDHVSGAHGRGLLGLPWTVGWTRQQAASDCSPRYSQSLPLSQFRSIQFLTRGICVYIYIYNCVYIYIYTVYNIHIYIYTIHIHIHTHIYIYIICICTILSKRVRKCCWQYPYSCGWYLHFWRLWGAQTVSSIAPVFIKCSWSGHWDPWQTVAAQVTERGCLSGQAKRPRSGLKWPWVPGRPFWDRIWSCK